MFYVSRFTLSSLSLARVDNELPRVTIIVPTKPGQAEIKSVEAARGLDYPREKLEVIVARGKQPAIQRNRALREASGEIIYFLDDDSQPAPDVLRRAVEHFRDPAVKIVGGPNLCPPDAPFIEQVFAVVLSSWIAFGPSRARYDRVGRVRATSEKELILCNLLARRSALLELGGFDESLYPNEENALMDELQKRGGKLIYDPDVIAYRRPRPTLYAFCRMLMTYGRGRAEQFRLHPTFGSALNFVPPLFVLFLLLTPLWAGLGWYNIRRSSVLRVFENGDSVQSSSTSAGIAWFVLGAYAIALVGQTIVNCHKGLVRTCCALPLLFATHFFYGLGFWRGLFSRVNRTKPVTTEVTFDRIVL
jgi:cellulose synthase/poly-beta-1,6-N-acetylglucosamine synthase-like glycosyltransferase